MKVWPIILASAVAADSIQKYLQTPTDRTVFPAKIVSVSGSVENAEAVLHKGGGVAKLSRLQPKKAKVRWPHGTKASGSSSMEGFAAQNAVDGDDTTGWSDDTIKEYPDTLTIKSPEPVELEGITVKTSPKGFVETFEVEAIVDGDWTTVAEISDNTDLTIRVPFQSTVRTDSLRITTTQAQNASQGEFTRINEVYPEILPTSDTPEMVIDFGRNVVGWTSIGFASAKQTPGIRLAFSESLQYLTNISDFTRSDNGDTITPGTDQIAVKDKQYEWVAKNGCEFGEQQVCCDGLHGFRYMKIYLDAIENDLDHCNPYGEVEIDYVSLNYSAYLGTADTYTGTFECSDEELNQFWYDAVYTNDLTIDHFRKEDVDARDSYSLSLDGKQVLFDGAKRDRDPYVGDLGVAARTAYLSHSELESAVTNILADLGDHQREDGWIPPASINNYTLELFDYPLWWVVCGRDHLYYTGKTDYVEKYYKHIQNVLNVYYPDKMRDGLVVKDHSTNTSSYGDFAFLPRTGIVTYYNSLYTLALQYGAEIASTLGDTDQADKWINQAEELGTAMNSKLWDEENGAYIDNSNNGTSFHAQDGNSLAVIASVASSDQSSSLLDYLEQNAKFYGNPFYDHDLDAGFSERVYAFISYFELYARFMTNKGDSGIDQIKRTFGWMAKSGPGTFWEGIGPNGSFYEEGFTSLAHGWSTGVAPILTEFVLGVTPTAPGYKKWQLKPVPCKDIDWAKGLVSTPFGDIKVSWRVENSKTVVDITAPRDTEGTVIIGGKTLVAVGNSSYQFSI